MPSSTPTWDETTAVEEKPTWDNTEAVEADDYREAMKGLAAMRQQVGLSPEQLHQTPSLVAPVGKAMEATGKATGDIAKAYAFEAIGEPELQAKQLGISDATLKQAGLLTEPSEPGVSPWEQGERSLSLPGRILASGTSGLIESTPQIAAVTALQAGGVPAPVAAGAVFGITPEGFNPKHAAIGAALPFVSRYTGKITMDLAKRLNISQDVADDFFFHKLGGVAGAAGLVGADQLRQIMKLPPDQREQALVSAVGNVASIAWLGLMNGRTGPSPEQVSEYVSNLKSANQPETPYAKTIREDTGQRSATGQEPQGSEANRGSDVEQAASVQPEPVGTRAPQAQSAQGEVVLTEDEARKKAEQSFRDDAVRIAIAWMDSKDAKEARATIEKYKAGQPLNETEQSLIDALNEAAERHVAANRETIEERAKERGKQPYEIPLNDPRWDAALRPPPGGQEAHTKAVNDALEKHKVFELRDAGDKLRKQRDALPQGSPEFYEKQREYFAAWDKYEAAQDLANAEAHENYLKWYKANKKSSGEAEPAKPVTNKAQETVAKPTNLEIGDAIRVADIDSVLANTATTPDGVKYEIFNAAKGSDKRAVVRATDVDSGNVISIKKYPTYDAAEKEYDDAVSKAGKPTKFPSLIEFAKSKLPPEQAQYIYTKTQAESFRAQWEKEKAAYEKQHPESLTAWPEPNENGVYDKDDAETLEYKSKKASAQIYVLQLPNGWIAASGYQHRAGNMADYGGPLSPFKDEQGRTYGYRTRQQAIQAEAKNIIEAQEHELGRNDANAVQKAEAQKIIEWANKQITKAGETEVSLSERQSGVTAPKPGFIRMYHGGADPRGKLNGPRDITPYYNYAAGYAAKTGSPVWYVDVPENAPYMKKAFEDIPGGTQAPYINTVAPADVMKHAKIAKPPKAGATAPATQKNPATTGPTPGPVPAREEIGNRPGAVPPTNDLAALSQHLLRIGLDAGLKRGQVVSLVNRLARENNIRGWANTRNAEDYQKLIAALEGHLGNEVELGVNRPEKINPALQSLSDKAFDKEYAEAKKKVDALEKQYDAGNVDRQKLAEAQDRWASADLERFRRNIKDTDPGELFDDLLKEPNQMRQALMLAELQRQGASLDELLHQIDVSSPDKAEVFRGRLEQLKGLLQAQAGPAQDQQNAAVDAQIEQRREADKDQAPRTHNIFASPRNYTLHDLLTAKSSARYVGLTDSLSRTVAGWHAIANELNRLGPKQGYEKIIQKWGKALQAEEHWQRSINIASATATPRLVNRLQFAQVLREALQAVAMYGQDLGLGPSQRRLAWQQANPEMPLTEPAAAGNEPERAGHTAPEPPPAEPSGAGPATPASPATQPEPNAPAGAGAGGQAGGTRAGNVGVEPVGSLPSVGTGASAPASGPGPGEQAGPAAGGEGGGETFAGSPESELTPEPVERFTLENVSVPGIDVALDRKQPINKRLKVQKQFLTKAIDEAIRTAKVEKALTFMQQKLLKDSREAHDEWLRSPDADKFDRAKALARRISQTLPHIRIEVPGDGEFTIVHTKEALREFAETVKNDFPTVIAKPSGPTLPSGKPGSLPKVGEGTEEDAIAAAAPHIGEDPTRVSIHHIYGNGKEIVATDGRRMIRVLQPGLGTQDAPAQIDPKTKKVEPWDYKMNGTFPNFSQVVPADPKFVGTANAADLWKAIKMAGVMTTDRSNSIKLYRNNDGTFGATSHSDLGEAQHNIKPDAKLVGMFQPEFLMDVVASAQRMGAEKVDVYMEPPMIRKQDNHRFPGPVVIQTDKVQGIVMPMKIEDEPAPLVPPQLGQPHFKSKFPEPTAPKSPEAEAPKKKRGKKGEPPEKGPGMVGMGGALEGEVQPTGPRGEPAGPTYGVAHRVLEARRLRGVIGPIERGEGIAPEASVERGRELLNAGADPEKVMQDFERTKRLSSDDFAIARAHGEKLEQAMYRASDEFGPNSPQAEAAWEANDAWARRVKAMSTEWNRMGTAQQGETDIDTGEFFSLRKAYMDDTAKDFTPEQKQKAQKIAEGVSNANDEAEKAREKVFDALDKETGVAPAKPTKSGTGTGGTGKTQKSAPKTEKIVTLKDVREAFKNFKPGSKFTPEQLRALWRYARGTYLDKGQTDFDDLRNKLSTDIGIPLHDVTRGLATPRGIRKLTDDMWRKQQAARRLAQQARQWLRNQATPLLWRALQSVPRYLFGLKVGFHGTVALGTHAPMVAFQPRFWTEYMRNFGRMYRMVGSKAYYERQAQDLLRRPNWTTARRAGLVNDPFTYEDFNSPDTAKYFGRLSGMGDRGYFVLKILRQDMFDQMWNELPDSLQTPEVAGALADGINHATGVVKSRGPRGLSNLVFAPRLEMSRLAWLFSDPLVRSGRTFTGWKNASESEKIFAKNQVKEKAWVFGTMMALLAINAGMLALLGSKQKINFFNPMKADWLKFKAAGMTLSYGNPMLNLVRLPARLTAIRESSGGKLKNIVYPDESSYTAMGEYLRSQESPAASLATDLWFKSDWQNRPLPDSTRPVPKRLAAQGVKPYTWTEFATEQLLPIPLEEGAREVWRDGLGMNPEQVKQTAKAFGTIVIMGGTGARLEDDRELTAPATGQ